MFENCFIENSMKIENWYLKIHLTKVRCAGKALSLTYGRFFAEFLDGKSLVPLGLLALSTCVGFRYGPNFFYNA